ncbi:MAG: Na+/H+ antiporter NhaA [Romboutsia timonensis]|uniref:Na+/H+ antiporter NhaA n=1 Tax=Romboutsia timonensis TaxID=1776391 RepID=UPI002A7568B6|nr:Na+/H+ antiporter NhaA [Romboutsia timonensis]MDY3001538.1 Na+/H+ antiporter NhaA [Romboutsia timonensis]
MKLEGKVTGRRLKQVNPEILTSILLVSATILALIMSNTGLREEYHYVFNDIKIFGEFNLHLLINDLLMAIFFLVVGCEIKYEILHGHLSSVKKAAFPVIAACGGVALPAIIFLMSNYNTRFSNGIGIPISTDIAFAVGVFMVLKNKLDPSLKVFLLSLAVVDDLISILVIGIAYSSDINLVGIIGAIGVMCILIYMNKILKVKKAMPYMVVGIALWFFVYISRIHSTISGVLLAMCLPANIDNGYRSVLENVNDNLSPLCNYLILPLFAFSNTGINLSANVNYSELKTLIKGIMGGLIIGKPLGIILFSYIGVKLHLIEKPKDTTWSSLLQVAILAGIGFTMSIFVTEIAFSGNQDIIDASKICILVSGVLSSTLTCTTIFLKPYLNRRYIISHLPFGLGK